VGAKPRAAAGEVRARRAIHTRCLAAGHMAHQLVDAHHRPLPLAQLGVVAPQPAAVRRALRLQPPRQQSPADLAGHRPPPPLGRRRPSAG
jgi:hypothetical protein